MTDTEHQAHHEPSAESGNSAILLDDGNPETELVAADDAVIGRAFRWSIVAFALIGVVVTTIVWRIRQPGAATPTLTPTIHPPQVVDVAFDPPVLRFTDITNDAGIDFVHENGATGDKLMPETMGAGCAFFDFDNDGDQDILLVNSTHWPGNAVGQSPPTMGLFMNDGSGRYTNVTAGSGLDVGFYGTGVAVGDYDGDGWIDVYISALGSNHLFRNERGQFRDVTDQAGVAGAADAWSTSAGFLDYDGDGDLDLFVCNYIRWSRDIDFEVDYRLVGIGRAYGPPMNFQGTYPYLFRNDGGGKFSEVASDAGMYVNNPATGQPMAKALGVAMLDADADGWIDLLVANDTVQNFFFHNQGDGSFVERGAEMGVAFDREGMATGAMGIDAGHFRNNEDVGYFIGNFANEMTSVYVSQGSPLLFADEAIGEGIGSTSRSALSFGLFLFDADLDGRLDLLQANGHLEDEINKVQSSQNYEQATQLFWNCGHTGTAGFVAVEPGFAGELGKPIVGRGAAYADIDGDGDLDILITQPGRRSVLLRNDLQLKHHWVRIQLVGRSPNTGAIGAAVVATVNGQQLRRQVMPTRSYLSQVELPVTIGLGTISRLESLRVNWPSGRISELNDVAIDRVHVIREDDAPAGS